MWDNGGQYIEDDSVDIIEVINTKLTTEIDKINPLHLLSGNDNSGLCTGK